MVVVSMAVRAIPKRLLIHTITYEEFIQDDWGESFAPPQTIRYVRVEPINAIIRSNIRDDVEGSTLVFIDRKCSNPFLRLKERSRVTFGGKKYEVEKVSEYFDDETTPHHYEVVLK